MIIKKSKNEARIARHKRYRKYLSGTSERPRLVVYRSNKNISAQIIDDMRQMTLVSASSIEHGNKFTNGSNQEAAKIVGTTIAQRALAQGINTVVFDRSGFLYHGRVKELAEAARAVGLKF